MRIPVATYLASFNRLGSLLKRTAPAYLLSSYLIAGMSTQSCTAVEIDPVYPGKRLMSLI